MPPLNQQEIRERAFAFQKDWQHASRERAEAQTFWNEFFNIFGISRRRVATFEEPVKKLGDRRGSIDLFWKGTLLVEHKSKGEDLAKAYGQALDYFPGITEQDLPQYVLVSDFTTFLLHDLETGEAFDFTLAELPSKLHLFGFISGYKKRTYRDEDPVNITVAEKMGELHDELLESGYAGHELEVFLVRLIYCLFADDTGIFPKDHFEFFLQSRTHPNGSDTGSVVATIFQILNKPANRRQTTTDEDLQLFPYVNGSLFREALFIPSFNANMRRILLECCAFDWSKVSPAIFGSMFQSVMNIDKARRRNLGAHYTSERNILKVVRGLFLDELISELEAAKNDVRKLGQLHDRLAGLKLFDPACGCGNFLIITYRELRRLEIAILKQLRKISGREFHQLITDVSLISRIDVDAMYGIEIEEFPARIAEVALWLTDHQVNMELSDEFGQTFVRLPLEKSANIRHGNALRIDWTSFVAKPADPRRTMLYLLGNPPFVGKKARSSAQNEDMETVCGEIPNFGILDYVCAWYKKAAEFIQGTSVQVAFVSTNSITQGEQVGTLWHYLLRKHITINFAHRTFRWSNEARGKAAVYCVIIGFSVMDLPEKSIYDYAMPDSEPMEIRVRRINPYLVDAENILLPNRNKPISEVPDMSFGSMPNDGGHLLLTDEEKAKLVKKNPGAARFIKPLISAHEYLHGEKRWCLWLVSATPSEIRAIPELKARVEAVREYRTTSKRPATRQLADYASLFAEIRQPEGNYVLIPRHSSENRKYIPISFFTRRYIAGDSCATLPYATLYHFGILSSLMHMAWVRQVGGRLEGRYRYSNNIVYNNFPWPEQVRPGQYRRVEKAAQEILDIRDRFSDSTLADLYDPSMMPKILVDAHRKLDAAVDACYRSKPFKSELVRLEFLFDLYLRYAEPLNHIMGASAVKTRKPKERVK